MTGLAIDLVIDAPDLQSRVQRLSTAVLLVTGWLLWAYFSFPFVELCGWFLDVSICSVWVNLSGGYLSLQRLLEIYALTIVGWLAAWSCLGISRNLRTNRPGLQAAHVPRADLALLCRDFGVDAAQVVECRASRVATVRFDSEGRIVGLEAR